MKKLMSMKPYGRLLVGNEVYFLLSPHPLAKDGNQADNQQKWFGVNYSDIEMDLNESGGAYSYYSTPMHIVVPTDLAIIEYRNDMSKILVMGISEEVDVPNLEDVLLDDMMEKDFTEFEDAGDEPELEQEVQ